jgi:hypothetical protein
VQSAHRSIVAQSWQEINAAWLSCQSWQDHSQRMILAMTFLLILLIVAAVLSIESVREAFHDGQGPMRPPVSHFEDPTFLGPLTR